MQRNAILSINLYPFQLPSFSRRQLETLTYPPWTLFGLFTVLGGLLHPHNFVRLQTQVTQIMCCALFRVNYPKDKLCLSDVPDHANFFL
jgi:hypothetical protein